MTLRRCASLSAVLLVLVLSACSGSAGDANTVTDDDPQALVLSLSSSAPAIAEGDSGDSPLLITLSLSAPADRDYSIDYSVASDSDGANPATAGSDFVAASGTLSVLAGESGASFSVSVLGDEQIEADETFVVRASNADLGSGEVVVTILDDDRPSLRIEDANGAEGDGALEFTVSLFPAVPGEAVSVEYASADGSAIARSDYSATSGTLTFAAGETSGTIPVPLLNDAVAEPVEGFTLTLSNPSANARISRASAAGSIADDDLVGVSVADVGPLSEGDDGDRPFTFVVSLSQALAEPVSIDYSTADISASAGSDYIATSGTLEIAAGQSRGEITVQVRGDTEVESDEQFGLTLESVSANAMLVDAGAVATIVNDDSDQPGAPVLAAIGAQTLVAGQSSSLALSATDPNGDSLSFSASLPAFATLIDNGDGSASLEFTPQLADLGSHSATLSVSDGVLEDSETFAILVTAADVVISEIMASNASTLADGDGDFADWIELHNRGDASVNLAGWCLSDDPTVADKWCFPSVELAPGAYRLVFASGKTGSAVAGELHAGFGLKRDGEYLALRDASGVVVSEYAPNFPPQTADISWGRGVLGGDHYFTVPTPGAANGEGFADVLLVDRSSLVMTALSGEQASPVQVALSALSGAALNYSIAVDDGGAGWLDAQVLVDDDGLTPDTLLISASAASLAGGSYSGTVTISSAGSATAVLAVQFGVAGDSGAGADVAISELMAANITTLADADGDFSDWIELHNRGTTAVNLTGWCLSDDPALPSRWCFSGGELPADGYLLVFASGKTGPLPGDEWHAGFNLNRGGEYLGLFKPDGSVASEYAAQYPRQVADVSYGLDAGDRAVYFAAATPGAANGAGVDDVLTFADNPLVVAATAGDPQSQFELELSSLNGATAAYSLSVDDGGAGWLAALPASAGDGSTPDPVALSIDPGALAAGSYSGTVTASAPGLGSAVLQVRLEVSATQSTFGDVVISEFMASNVSVLADAEGNFEDWIELHNRDVVSVDMGGWCLTDDPAQPQLWCFEDGPSLAAGEHRLVFASGAGQVPAARAVVRALGDEYHAGLRLARGGEYLALMRPDGSVASQFVPAYPEQFDDIAYGRDGAGNWGYFSSATPGAANPATVNRAPQLAPLAAQTLIAGDSLQLALSASDADGDALSFSLGAAPAFVVLDDHGDGTATLQLTPLAADLGEHSVEVSVSDGLLDDRLTLALSVVEPLNEAPQVVVVASVAVTAGSTLEVGVGASDADGDALTLSASGLPGWASFSDHGNGTGTLRLAPGDADAGSGVAVALSADDGSERASAQLQISVSDSATPDYQLVYSRSSDRSGSLLLDGARVSGDLFARIEPDYGIQRVAFALDDASDSFTTESNAPYELAGGGSRANPWDTTELADGRHRIRSLITLRDGSELVADAEFQVLNDGITLAPIAAQTVHPRRRLVLELSASNIDASALSFSLQGPDFASLEDRGDGSAALTLAPQESDLGEHELVLHVADAVSSISRQIEVSVVEGGPGLLINELLASNLAGLADAEGERGDWIELYNASGETEDLHGWCLSDDPQQPQRWCFDRAQMSTLLPAGEYLLVFASGKSPAPAGEWHASFALSEGGEYLGLFAPGESSAAHEFAAEYPALSEDVSYGIDGAGDAVYFAVPTPGSANGAGSDRLPQPVEFNAQRGFYDSALQLALNGDGTLESIRYTTDGSEPSIDSGIVYSGPITIDTTTVVRAAGFIGTSRKGGIATHSYVFLDDVIDQPADIPGYERHVDERGRSIDYEMDPEIVSDYAGEIIDSLRDIPSMSVAVDPALIYGDTGFYDTKDQKIGVSVEVIYPDDGDASHQVDAGIEAHSHDRAKRSLRLSFSRDFGAPKFETDLLDRAPLHGDSAVGVYDKLVLRGGNNRCFCRAHNPGSTSYTVDQFYRDTQLAASGHGMRGSYVHLYINGIYWGLYNVTERADKHFQADYFGGSRGDWFALNHGVVHDNALQLSGDATRFYNLSGWLESEADASVEPLRDSPIIELDMSVDANYALFREYVDVDNLIDYLLINWWSATNDWPDNNWYGGSRNASAAEGTTGLRLFAWDGEASWAEPQDFDNPSGQAKIHPAFLSGENVNSVGDRFFIAQLWHAARQNADFMARFAARVDELTGSGGALNDAVAIERWDALNDHVRSAVVAESARWGDQAGATRTRDEDWQDFVNDMRDILDGNAAQLRSQLRAEGFID